MIAIADEKIDESKDLLIFDPIETWKKTNLEAGTFTVRELLVPIFEKGICVYNSPILADIKEYCSRELDTLWDETRRFMNPHEVYVDLSDKLYDMKKQLLDGYSKR